MNKDHICQYGMMSLESLGQASQDVPQLSRGGGEVRISGARHERALTETLLVEDEGLRYVSGGALGRRS